MKHIQDIYITMIWCTLRWIFTFDSPAVESIYVAQGCMWDMFYDRSEPRDSLLFWRGKILFWRGKNWFGSIRERKTTKETNLNISPQSMKIPKWLGAINGDADNLLANTCDWYCLLGIIVNSQSLSTKWSILSKLEMTKTITNTEMINRKAWFIFKFLCKVWLNFTICHSYGWN